MNYYAGKEVLINATDVDENMLSYRRQTHKCRYYDSIYYEMSKTGKSRDRLVVTFVMQK